MVSGKRERQKPSRLGNCSASLRMIPGSSVTAMHAHINDEKIVEVETRINWSTFTSFDRVRQLALIKV